MGAALLRASSGLTEFVHFELSDWSETARQGIVGMVEREIARRDGQEALHRLGLLCAQLALGTLGPSRECWASAVAGALDVKEAWLAHVSQLDDLRSAQRRVRHAADQVEHAAAKWVLNVVRCALSSGAVGAALQSTLLLIHAPQFAGKNVLEAQLGPELQRLIEGPA
ncbi:MAG: hypothetical protein KGJ86_00730 [Chloroflexota bacterium]|nr:hypothetical protein [Chloroflexota bacterium]